MHTEHSLKISKRINFLVQVEARINELYQQRQNMSIDQFSKEFFNESPDVIKQAITELYTAYPFQDETNPKRQNLRLAIFIHDNDVSWISSILGVDEFNHVLGHARGFYNYVSSVETAVQRNYYASLPDYRDYMYAIYEEAFNRVAPLVNKYLDIDAHDSVSFLETPHILPKKSVSIKDNIDPFGPYKPNHGISDIYSAQATQVTENTYIAVNTFIRTAIYERLCADGDTVDKIVISDKQSIINDEDYIKLVQDKINAFHKEMVDNDFILYAPLNGSRLIYVMRAKYPIKVTISCKGFKHIGKFIAYKK
ncbi:hypothetical protein [Pseudomonas aeruginosa]|uniref:hypothetical protein n=1 Tax=Pseudomonas aeruginosa TaxID=287 RepID=UPI001CA526BD|nr:hypothetical protein [Pseudomonas aeruginosa]MBW6072369.1 hypothetical protein [Pseudomonas aeruginosa]